jgi:hypothetical protein
LKEIRSKLKIKREQKEPHDSRSYDSSKSSITVTSLDKKTESLLSKISDNFSGQSSKNSTNSISCQTDQISDSRSPVKVRKQKR